MSTPTCNQDPVSPGAVAAPVTEGGETAIFQKLFDHAFDPEILACLQDVQETLAFSLPTGLRMA